MKIQNHQIKYVISLALCVIVLFFSVITFADNLKTTQTQIELSKVGNDEVKIAIKPEEMVGVTSFQIFLKVEEQKGWFNDNQVESVHMQWNTDWNLTKTPIEGKINVELAEVNYDTTNKIIHIYVVSKTELTNQGSIEVGTMKLKTKNEKDLTVNLSTITEKTYIVSPADQSASVQVAMDESIGKLSMQLATGKQPEQNIQSNESIQNEVSNEIINEITNVEQNTTVQNEVQVNTQVNQVTNEMVNNETINRIENTITNEMTNEVLTNVQMNETVTNQTISTNTQVGNSEQEKQEEHLAEGKLPQTGTVISILSVIVAVLAIIGIGHSIYHLKKKQ